MGRIGNTSSPQEFCCKSIQLDQHHQCHERKCPLSFKEGQGHVPDSSVKTHKLKFAGLMSMDETNCPRS